MKKILLLPILLSFVLVSKSQVLLNEVYPDPGAGKNEFFELYNSSIYSTPMSLDNYTLVCFFASATEEGFCVMDLPNLSVSPKGYFVGASNLPFSYQGVSNSTAADFSWNSPAFTSNNGYVKKWLKQTNNLADGNPDYDEVPIGGSFNDFFQRRTGGGASFTIFLYRDGNLINTLSLATGGNNGVIPAIVNMPVLYIDMSGASTDFSIDFSTYANIPVESVSQDAGSDNGFIREADGVCGSWTKSSSQVQHTPQQSNGYADALMGVISTTAIIQQGNSLSGSNFVYDVIAAPTTSFPVQLQAYKDNGTANLYLDAGDQFVESNTENVVTDGPFTTHFFPYNMNMLLVVISNAGCIDKVLYALSSGILPVKLVSFQGAINDKNITSLQWKVAENETIGSFEIEKSVDGVNFTRTGSVEGNGRKGEQLYNYSENIFTWSKIYYRLKIHDKNQQVYSSPIISFNNKKENKNNLQILGNPVKDKLTINFISGSNQTADVSIYSVNGSLQHKEKIGLHQGSNLAGISLPGSFNNGTYIVELNTGGEKFTTKFVKQ